MSTKVDYQSLPLLDHLARVGRRAAEASTPGGLRPRHLRALGILSERGPLSQQSLGEVLSLDPSNVVGLLNELEERGLITRRRDCSDRRRHIVELSTTGEEALAAAYVRLGLGVGLVAQMAVNSQEDPDLVFMDASHLFASHVTWIGFRRGVLLRNSA